MTWINKIIVFFMPLVPKFMVRPFARRYVAGESLEEMMGVVRRFHADGVMSTIDLLGEFITKKEQAEETLAEYLEVLKAVEAEGLNKRGEYPVVNVSVKLSALGLLLDKEFCYQSMRTLVEDAKLRGNFVRIDMEDTQCTTDTIDIYLRLRSEFDNVGIVLQAYLRRTLGDAREIMSQYPANFRLCKGIYLEPREHAFPEKQIVHKNFALVLEEMIRGKAYVGIATHHEELIWEAMRLIDHFKLKSDEYEFQMLLGIEPELRNLILSAGHRMRVYIPYGKSWHAYCMRRFKENPTIVSHILKNMFTRSGFEGSDRRNN